MNQNKKNIRKEYNITFNSIESQYLADLYGGTNGYVKLMCGHNRSGAFVPASALSGKNASKYINAPMLDQQNAMMSMSTFRSKKDASENNINTVCCLAVDLDYSFTDAKGGLFNPLEVNALLAQRCCEEDLYLPQPTYIEYGHRLRFVYVFKDPVVLPRAAEKRKRTISWLKRIMTVMCDNINSLDKRFGAEIQQLTKFVRVPNSTNTKTTISGYENGKPKYALAYKYMIAIKKPVNGKTWDVHELSDYILPDAPEWLGEYQAKKKKKPLVTIRTQSMSFLVKRMQLLEELPKLGWGEGYREQICFLYWNFGKQLGESDDVMYKRVQTLNASFDVPLNEHDIWSHCRPRKTYCFKMSTIVRNLDIPDDLMKKYCLSETDYKVYDREYSKRYRLAQRMKKWNAGTSKTQIKEKLTEKITRLFDAKKKIKDIAEALKISISTVYRHIHLYAKIQPT